MEDTYVDAEALLEKGQVVACVTLMTFIVMSQHVGNHAVHGSL
jgi:hypothetical protein